MRAMGAERLRIDAASDLVLLLLLESGEQTQRPIVGTTRLQKLLFLLSREPEMAKLIAAGSAPALDFRPYRMGPFTPEVYEAIDLLAQFDPALLEVAEPGDDRQSDLELDEYVDELDLDRSEPAVTSAPRPTVYRLTAPGKTVAQALWQAAPSELKEALHRVINEYGQLDLKRLLRLVYTRYPKFAERSEIRSQLGLQ